MARALEFTPEMGEAICERIAEGDSIRTICSDAAMPAMSTVFKWLDRNDDFAERYARAKEAQADRLFDQVLEIADSAAPETVNVARLQIDARKWMAGKLRPKKYGDKLELSGDPDRPLQVVTRIELVAPGSAQ